MSVTESALSMFEGREEGGEGGEGVGKLLEEIVERDGAAQVDPVDVMVSIWYEYQVYDMHYMIQMYMYVYVYMYTFVFVYLCIHVYIYFKP